MIFHQLCRHFLPFLTDFVELIFVLDFNFVAVDLRYPFTWRLIGEIRRIFLFSCSFNHACRMHKYYDSPAVKFKFGSHFLEAFSVSRRR